MAGKTPRHASSPLVRQKGAQHCQQRRQTQKRRHLETEPAGAAQTELIKGLLEAAI